MKKFNEMQCFMLQMVLLKIAFCVDGMISEDAGLKIRLSSEGLFHLADAAVKFAAKELVKITLPEISGSTKAAGGTVTYDLTNMRVDNEIQPSFNVQLVLKEGVKIQISNMFVRLSGNWRYRYKIGFIFITDHGSFDAKLSGLVLSIYLSPVKTQDGKLQINTMNCAGKFNDVDLDIHSKVSWLYDLIEDNIEKSANQPCAIFEQIRTSVLNKYLLTLPMHFSVTSSLTFDYRLHDSPVINDGSVDFYLNGQFSAVETNKLFNRLPQMDQKRSGGASDRMAGATVNQNLINSLVYSLKQSSYLRRVVTKNDLPKYMDGFLNTTCLTFKCFAFFIPQLGKLCPNSFVEITINSEQIPDAKILKEGILISVKNLTIDFQARFPNNSLVDLFTFAVNTSSVVSLNITKDASTVFWHVGNFTFNSQLERSYIGWIPSYLMSKISGFVLRFAVITEINLRGKTGLKIKSIPNIELLDTEVQFNDGFVSAGCNFRLKTKFDW